MLYFPHPFLADDDGFLAIGGDLTPERLLLAYRFGIFPWYQRQPICWFFTSPRCVLLPSAVHISKSMKSLLRQRPFEVTINKAFKAVISLCAQVSRPGQGGTWINGDIINAYGKLHALGYAHSVEIWRNGMLIGGLYGVALGKIFYGESMFAIETNASKYGLVYLCRHLESRGFELIDCQQKTQHMMTLGATMMDRSEFWMRLKENALEDAAELGCGPIRL